MDGMRKPVGRLLAGFALAVVLFVSGLVPASGAEPAAAPAEQEIRALIETIEDEGARTRLLQDLKALLAVAAEAEPAGPTIADRFMSGVSVSLHHLGGRLERSIAGWSRLLDSGGWLVDQLSKAERRSWWLTLAWQVALVLVAAFLLELLARRLLASPKRRIEERDIPTYAARLPWLSARSLLDLIPIAVFACSAYALLIWIDPGPQTRAVLISLLTGLVLARALTALMRMILTPVAPALRMHGLADRTAAYLFVWSRRLIRVAVYGFFLVEVAALLGLPGDAAAVLLRAVGLIVLLMMLVLILQNRRPVADWIAGNGAAGDGPLKGLHRSLGNAWHVLAVLYVVTAYGVWALEIIGGTAYVGRGTGMTILIVVVARVLADILGRGLVRLFRVSEAIRQLYPFLQAQTNRYLPMMQRVLTAFVTIVAVLAILQAWQINVMGWLASESGRDVLGRLFTIVIALLFALVVWEGTSGLINMYLQRKDQEGNTVVRSQRVRTLLPLIRNILLVVVATITTMVTLSELGIDIAPLLAGAGVIGLAIGFGAQTLVKDFITGLFIFLEDSLHVGDVASVGGRTGTVEALSVRAVTMRDLSGTVHTIPFSTVDVVENLTKDFSYAVLDVGVGYSEDVDQVIDVLEEIGEELRADEVFGPRILAPLEVFGLNEFGDSAIVVRVRLKTIPAAQWGLKRAFNKRIKEKFDALGIEIPFPHRTIYFGIDKAGNAPPMRLAMADASATAGGASPTAPAKPEAERRHRGLDSDIPEVE
jgi:small conductance mechanosensitive channel